MASCATPRDPRPWHGTFEKFRPIARTLTTGKAVEEEFGAPERWDTFPNWHGKIMSRELWQSGFVTEPPGLIATMPAGTKLMAYFFSTGDALNPTVVVSYACIDDSDRVIGWMFAGYLDAYPEDVDLMGLPRQHR